MARLSIADLADTINEDCDAHRHFWACQLVKETLSVWCTPQNYHLLCPDAQRMVDHYEQNRASSN